MTAEKNGLPILNIDRFVVFLFVLFMLSEEARNLLNMSGLRWAYLLLLSLGIGYVGTPVAHWVAHRLGVLDVPRGRKAHGQATALLGGVAIYVAFAVTVLRNFHFTQELKGVALGGTLMLIVGVIDDVRELRAPVKLLAQLAAVAILIHYGVVISFLPDGPWGTAGEWVLTAIWVIGITNAVNFLDGMDGLAAGTCCINLIFFGLVALFNEQHDMGFLALPLVGACLSFLVFNFPFKRPASIFLGDGGSTFLGFMVAAIAVMGEWASDHAVRLVVPVIILGVPIFDMSFTTLMRLKSGRIHSVREWLEFTGRDHIHHRLEDLRIGRRGAVLVIYAVTVWLGLSALALEKASGFNAALQLSQSAIVFLLLGFFMTYVSKQYAEIERQASAADGGSNTSSTGSHADR